MSNYLALATLTATVGHLVRDALGQIPGPSAPAVRFGAPQVDANFAGCTIFLSRVGFIDHPRPALEADYLFTFAGDEAKFEPQRFLGAVVRWLHANPVLTRDAIQMTIAASPELQGSDLDAQVDPIRLTPRNGDQQTLGQLVNVFPHAPYNVWVLYTASAIVLS